MAKAGVEEGNKDLQLNVVDALKKKRKLIASKRLMKLDVRDTVFMSVRPRMNGNENQRKSLNH